MTEPNPSRSPQDDSFHDDSFHDGDDAVLDGLLNEVFTGASPPDLTATILHRLRTEQADHPDPTPPPVVVPMATAGPPGSPLFIGLGLLAVAASLMLAVAWFPSDEPARRQAAERQDAVRPSSPFGNRSDDRSLANDLDSDSRSEPIARAEGQRSEEPISDQDDAPEKVANRDAATPPRSLSTPDDSPE